ncbi:MAG: hypothetical protein HY815_05640 [Candidatus Riflebacteria bacterium]|nr:hypothetical protein [Candidatus Riflebacteria bacterium]
MHRSLRIALFFGLVLAVWTLCSDQLLSRVTTDEPQEEPGLRSDGQDESDYQVVRLLNKLFTLIKRNYLEVLNLHARINQTRDREDREQLAQSLEERLGFIDEKGQEYLRLEPNLREQYPQLGSVISSFTKDLANINRDLERVKRLNRFGRRPAKETRLPEEESRTQEEPTEARPRARSPRPAASRPPGGGDITLPITLEIRGAKGENVADRKVQFTLVQHRASSLHGIVDQAGGLVTDQTVSTDATGKATIQLRVADTNGPIRIRRTIIAQGDQTICKLEIVQK